MTVTGFMERLRTQIDGQFNARNYVNSRDQVVLIVDAWYPEDRERIAGCAQACGLQTENVIDAEWYGNRRNVRVAITGFGA